VETVAQETNEEEQDSRFPNDDAGSAARLASVLAGDDDVFGTVVDDAIGDVVFDQVYDIAAIITEHEAGVDTCPSCDPDNPRRDAALTAAVELALDARFEPAYDAISDAFYATLARGVDRAICLAIKAARKKGLTVVNRKSFCAVVEAAAKELIEKVESAPRPPIPLTRHLDAGRAIVQYRRAIDREL
jgi:hypothetical protein